MSGNVLYANLELLQNPLWLAAVAAIIVSFLALFLSYRWARYPASAPPTSRKTVAREFDDYDPFIDGSRSEKRRALRRKGEQVEVELADDEEDVEVWKGWVVDRSAIGLRLISAQPCEIGTRLRIRAHRETEDLPWIDIDVRRCTPITVGWELGCEFVRPPAWNLLLTFG